MTTLKTIKSWIRSIESTYPTPRMAARELAEKFEDVEVLEAPTQDCALISCDECLVVIKWANRMRNGIIAREASCPEF